MRCAVICPRTRRRFKGHRVLPRQRRRITGEQAQQQADDDGTFHDWLLQMGINGYGANSRGLAANEKLSDLIVSIDFGDYGVAAASATFVPTSGYG
jgi:hypothetical protein